jgi:hypothetical protein
MNCCGLFKNRPYEPALQVRLSRVVEPGVHSRVAGFVLVGSDLVTSNALHFSSMHKTSECSTQALQSGHYCPAALSESYIRLAARARALLSCPLIVSVCLPRTLKHFLSGYEAYL